MEKHFLLIIAISLLWHMCSSTYECNRIITTGHISFVCPSSVSDQGLNLYDLTATVLDSITSITAGGGLNSSIGPFTSLPSNLCLLRNLQSIDFSSNQIVQVDPTGSFSSCLSKVVSLNLQSNQISQFPSFFIYNLPNIVTLNFQNNLLRDVPGNAFRSITSLDTINFSYNQLTTFEFWALEVITRADFSNNRISTITNNYFFQTFSNTTVFPTISLTNNSATINLTDAIYEMYNQCNEAYIWLNSEDTADAPLFTTKVAQIDFGTSQINCSCDQRYFLQILKTNYASPDGIPLNFPIRTATCVGNSLTAIFINSSCITTTFDVNSTVNFRQVYPRLCEIYNDEGGNLTVPRNMTAPTSNASTYPHYITASMSPGACFFTFTNATAMSISCTSDTSNSSSTIPSDLLNNTYMSNIQYVSFSSPISSLPSYLCSLPSGIINLSYQAFTTLTDATFPCLDSFTTIILSHNNLTSVSTSNINFQKLFSIDLSSNFLTALPYSILRPTPTSLRYLNLQNNLINSVDLFLYTLQNITVYLDNNPINGSVIINPQNATLNSNSSSSVNITFPANITIAGAIIQDSTVQDLVKCASFLSIQSALSSLRSSIGATLRCTCASFRLRQLYRANGQNIVNTFPCSNAVDGQTFQNLTNTTCTNIADFQTTLCSSSSQISTDMTTMTSFNTSLEYTSTPFTIITANSSSSTLNSTNQTQITTPPGSTTPAGNITSENSTSSRSSTPPSNTTSSGNSTFSDSTTPGSNTTSSGNSTSSGGTTLSRNSTSLASTTPSSNITSSGNSTSSGSTTLSRNSTSLASTTPSSNITSFGNSTSSGSTTLSGNSTSSASTTPSSNITSFGNSTSAGGTTLSGNSTSLESTTPSSNTTSSGNSTSSGSTTLSGNSTSSASTTPSSNITSSGNSTSSGSTTLSGNSTSSASTTPSSNITSFGNSTSGGNTNSSSTTISGGTISHGNSATSGGTVLLGNETITGTTSSSVDSSSTTAAAPQLGTSGPTSNRTGLIVGLVVGLVGFFLLVSGLVAAILFLKSKGVVAKGKKPISRAAVIGQGPGDSLSNRVQPRSLRAVRLAPIPTSAASPLPNVPVKAFVPAANSGLLSQPNTTLRTSAKGIPVRLDPIRSPSEVNPQYPPNSNALNNSSSFRPINNVSTHQVQIPQQQYQIPKPQKPRANPLLNIGGDIHY